MFFGRGIRYPPNLVDDTIEDLDLPGERNALQESYRWR